MARRAFFKKELLQEEIHFQHMEIRVEVIGLGPSRAIVWKQVYDTLGEADGSQACAFACTCVEAWCIKDTGSGFKGAVGCGRVATISVAALRRHVST